MKNPALRICCSEENANCLYITKYYETVSRVPLFNLLDFSCSVAGDIGSPNFVTLCSVVIRNFLSLYIRYVE